MVRIGYTLGHRGFFFVDSFGTIDEPNVSDSRPLRALEGGMFLAVDIVGILKHRVLQKVEKIKGGVSVCTDEKVIVCISFARSATKCISRFTTLYTSEYSTCMYG